jgi:hypothetical protein
MPSLRMTPKMKDFTNTLTDAGSNLPISKSGRNNDRSFKKSQSIVKTLSKAQPSLINQQPWRSFRGSARPSRAASMTIPSVWKNLKSGENMKTHFDMRKSTSASRISKPTFLDGRE